VGWAAALLIVWVQAVLPVSLRLDAYLKKTKESQKIEAARDAHSGKKSPGQQRADKKRLDESRTQATQLFAELKKIRTPLGEVELPAWYVPPLYSLLLAGFVAYFMRRRMILNAMALRAVHLNVERLGRSTNDISGFGAWAPFWLSPLPRIRTEPGAVLNETEAAESRLAFLGWRHSHRRSTALVVLILATAGVAWWWTLAMARKMDDVRPGGPVWMHWEVHALIALATLIVALLYLRPTVIWGAFPERLVVETASRRTFFRVALTAVGAAAGLSVLPSSLAVRVLPTLRMPRFRIRVGRQEKPLSLRGGFFQNIRTCIVHAVDYHGWVLMRRTVAERNLFPVTDAQLTTLYVGVPATVTAVSGTTMRIMRGRARRPSGSRVDFRQSQTVAERLAIKLARQGNAELALQVVWAALNDGVPRWHGAPNYRLYDLYSGLLLRAHSPVEPVAAFQDLLGAGGKDDVRLQAIAARLAKPSDRWRRRWTGPAIDWRFPAPPKPRQVPLFTRVFDRFRPQPPPARPPGPKQDSLFTALWNRFFHHPRRRSVGRPRAQARKR
jgi:hypothetical protein